MGNINIGFHAQNDEVVKWINSVMLQYQLSGVVVKLWPDFEYQIIDTMREEYLNSARFIFFSKAVPSQLSDNYYEFLVQNAESLVLQIGERTEESMKESTLGTRASDSENIKLWKKVIRIFKKEMYNGVWVMDPRSGVKKYYKNHYFTIGAKNAYEKGIKMKGTAGISEYQLILEDQNNI